MMWKDIWHAYGITVQVVPQHTLGITIQKIVHTEATYPIDRHGSSEPSTCGRSRPPQSRPASAGWKRRPTADETTRDLPRARARRRMP